MSSRLTVSWNDSGVLGANLYDSNCNTKVIIGIDDMPRIWTPDIYIFNAIDTVHGIGTKFLLKRYIVLH